MKPRGIVFLLEWVLANVFVWNVLNDAYSFSMIPWVLWNVTFGIFLFKLFATPEYANGGVWPIGPTVGAFGFVLTAVRFRRDDIHNNDNDNNINNIINNNSASDMSVSCNVILGCLICLFGFSLIGISSDALGDEWRDAPPPESSNESGGDDTEKTVIGEKSDLTLSFGSSTSEEKGYHRKNKNRNNLITDGPYGIIRHPIYCGLLLEALGSTVAGGFSSWIALGALVSVTTAYVVQINQEEHELNKLLDGKYDSEYKQRTIYKLVPFVF